MTATAHPTVSSVAGSAHAPAGSTLEDVEAWQRRDALETLLRREQAAMGDILVALADFDRGRGWEALGHASLFAFLTVELSLSRSAASWRLSAAGLLERFPEAIEPLRHGRLCLSTTAELAKVLAEQNLMGTLTAAAEPTRTLRPVVTTGPNLSRPVQDLRGQVKAPRSASPATAASDESPEGRCR